MRLRLWELSCLFIYLFVWLFLCYYHCCTFAIVAVVIVIVLSLPFPSPPVGLRQRCEAGYIILGRDFF